MHAERYFHPKIETMHREKLMELQFERLKKQIERCYNNSDFYKERFKKAGISPEDIRDFSDFEAIPPITKNELREEQKAYPPFGRYTVAPQSDWRELHPSTGTTGIPVYTIWTEKDVENITSWTARTMWMSGVRPNDVVQNGFSYGLWVAGLACHYAAREIGCFIIPIGAISTERQIDYFMRVKPTVFLATPSFALYLSEKLKERGISPNDLSLRMGMFGGEAGTEIPSTRKKIEEGLGIEAYDYYGLAEIGPTIASECEAKAGIHWVEDHILVEVLDIKTKKRCEPGEIGVLVLTHLTKEGTPLIRYWTNDLAKVVVDKCECGRTLARSPGGILGRADDMIIYKGVNFYPAQVEKVVRSFPELSPEYIIKLETDKNTGIDKVTVVVECLQRSLKSEGLLNALKEALRDELSVTPYVEIVDPGTLPRTEFKAKRILDKRKKE